MKPVLRLTFGEETFDVVKLMASEVGKIQLWTQLSSKNDWIDAIGREDIEAFKAGYTLMKQRAGEKFSFTDADFDTDTMGAAFVDPATGRPVMVSLVLDEDGDPVMDKKKRPIPVKDADGAPVWVFTDTGEEVPPTGVEAAASSTTPPSSGSSTASEPGTTETSNVSTLTTSIAS